ncbi:adenosylcobinamide-GDP ribazoletransferase [Acinetobacter defluvii]|uniref:Adenosylcobinamide-GDP ribazoletransferase n=1 Tax=Acinetobacter defluvii TaxID=1871111 RepID=A0A2S2FCV5_9GAMM|nr:adenosylcobinamide-GDP ribazoletransferase [Acinetobacter defluvii]AWL28738.1 adenosylcobinamide-GDP ribazoletransferase [Acinetobacter defluvii]
MTPFLIALQFLTTFPIQLKSMPSPQQNGQSLLFYPVVGLLIGLILFFIAYIFQNLPIILLASIILFVWIWLTGGLHLDGLADTADAWVGGFGDKERTLAIMKDPSCGPIGVLSLIMVCLLKWSAIYVLLQQKILFALVIFPVLGRIAPLILFLTTPYVRKNGLGTALTEYIPKQWAIFTVLIALLIPVYFSWMGIFSSLIFILSLFYLRLKFIQRIEGITGDTVGASIEILEMLTLFSFVVLSFYF